MPQGVEINISDIRFNENATIMKIVNGENITEQDLVSLYSEACDGKIHNFQADIRRQSIVSCPGLLFSFRLFKSQNKPSFFISSKKGWDEQKIGYLLFVEYNGYVAIIKRNASSIKSILNKLEPLAYDQFLCLYIDSNTEFEKLNMSSIDGSSSSIRTKTYEANDLRENFSTVGANRFVLRNVRAKNNNDKVVLALSSSRVNEFKSQKSITEICKWVKNTIDSFVRVIPHDTFLSVFASSISYEQRKESLTPGSVLLFANSIVNGIEKHSLTFQKVRNNGNVSLSEQALLKYLSYFTKTLDVSRITDANGNISYWASYNGVNTGVEIQMQEKGIKLKSKSWNRIKVISSITHNEYTLNAFINNNNEFNVYFENSQMIYTNHRLYEDNHLLGNIDHFLKVFKHVPRLNFTDSEKGERDSTINRFDPKSVFDVVEHYALGIHNYLICDDYGNEWADHIGISEDKVSFYVSKHKDSVFSASDFQDVVGQALKNLGNLAPTESQLNGKIPKWQGNWNGTPLPRLRNTGGTVLDAVDLWKRAVYNPYFRREMNLVVDFLSLNDITTYLTNIKDNIPFARKNEAYQLLWLLSSLISNCRQVDVDVNIYCKK